MPSLWNQSTLTLGTTKSEKSRSPSTKRNKLRRRRRPSPLRKMSDIANGVPMPSTDDDGSASMPTPMSAAASSSPTLLDKHLSSSTHRERDADKDDAQTQVIDSLRTQISDLITQVSQLNGKLVKSYDRVSDLEDNLHIASQNARTSSLKISELEIERAQHLSALNTGLYVEKAHVTAELTRLMERATAEAAARGQAETARETIEHELDDLSASLFDQANKMVVEARLARAMSERKVVDAEMALHGAEEAVTGMQLQMQQLREDRDHTADEIARLRTLMQKGKFVEHPPLLASVSIKLSNQHTPYHEFIQFVTHLRTLRPTTSSSPQVSTLLNTPFLARIQTEDSEPTVRLDFAPSLNWLSRRSVLSAIHGGQLSIEPMSVSALLTETNNTIQSILPGSNTTLSCALCGSHIFSQRAAETLQHGQPTPFVLARNASANMWSSFKNPLGSAAPSPPLTPPPLPRESKELSLPANTTTVHVFKLAYQPGHQSQTSVNTMNQMQRQTYPLCMSGWCLARLRATCSLWAFIRAGVIDRVWEEEIKHLPQPLLTKPAALESTASFYSQATTAATSSWTHVPATVTSPQKESPPVPPRRRSKISSVGALWGMASGALRNSSQPSSPSHTNETDVSDGAVTKSPTPSKFSLGFGNRAQPPEPLKVTVPPPLPRRSLGRQMSASEKEDSPSSLQPEFKASPMETSTSDPSTSEKTPIAAIMELKTESLEVPPIPERLSASNSESSGLSGSISSEGFKTPNEIQSPVLGPTPTTERQRSKTPSPPLSPRSPSRPRAGTSTPPLSPAPQRLSSPPPFMSPRQVPLPDSRPVSPVPVTPPRGRNRPMSGSVTSPSTISPLSYSNKAPSRPTTPSQLGSPTSAPPPLPRRAAARRAAPVPPSAGAVTIAPISNTESNEKVPSPEEPPAKLDEGKPRESVRKSADLSVPSPSPGGRRISLNGPRPPPAKPNRKNTRSPEPSSAHPSDAGSQSGDVADEGAPTLRLDEAQLRPKLDTQIDLGEEDSKADIKIETTEATPVNEIKPDGVESTSAVKEAPIEPISESPVTDSKSEATHAQTAEETKTDSPVARASSDMTTEAEGNPAMAPESEDKLAEGFVGDATWEERTWKEIVRLREDMFWARVGGVRS